MDNRTILSIRDLRVVFEDGFTALGGVSIDIGENEFVTLLRPAAAKRRFCAASAALRSRPAARSSIRGRTSSPCRRISVPSTRSFSAMRSSRI